MTSRTAVLAALIAAISISTLVAIAPSAAAASCGRQTAADGTVVPITCKGGMPNTAVRAALAKESPKVMALGKSATLAQVKTAVCTDTTEARASNPMVVGALTWQSANFHWPKSYKTRLTKAIENGTICTS